MNELILQMIINKMETIIKKKVKIEKLDLTVRNEIKKWSLKMYNDFEKNKELEIIKDNNLEDYEFENYFDNDYLLYL